jgi:hypothetical protein
VSGLKKAYLNRRKTASAGLAAQGQGYSGAHERALARTRQEEEAAYNELRNAYMAAVSSLSEKERETKYSSEEARDAAFKEWLDRAPEADEGEETIDEDVDEGGGAPFVDPTPNAAAELPSSARAMPRLVPTKSPAKRRENRRILERMEREFGVGGKPKRTAEKQANRRRRAGTKPTSKNTPQAKKPAPKPKPQGRRRR